MSKSEIMAELPRLTASDQSQLFVRLAELLDAELPDSDLLGGGWSSLAEEQLLVKAFAELKSGPCPGETWHKALQEIRESRR
jgi:hypothetical protein